MKKNNLFLLTYLISLLFVFTGCNDNDNPIPQEEESIFDFVHEGMTDAYLWYKEAPQEVNPENYTDPIKMFEDMLYKPTDRWSILVKDNGSLVSQINEGENNGVLGFSAAYDAEGKLRVVMVLVDSPADEAGIKRGDIIQKINGTVVEPFSDISLEYQTLVFEILSADDNIRTVSLTRANIDENPVLHTEVKEMGGMKIGYLVFNTFNGLAFDRLDEAFGTFKTASIDELVIDLRYNGGGLVTASQHFASLIVPPAHYGKTFVKLEHNDKNTAQDTTLVFEKKANSLSNLSRVVFLVTERTSSASEMLINSLKPFIDVTVIGSKTDGKYVIATPSVFEGYTFIPITSQGANTNGDIFIGGFTPNIEVADDITHSFGDVEEGMFKVALDYLSGLVGLASKSKVLPNTPIKILNHEGLQNLPALLIK